jgi:hypothetical protein
LWEVLPEVLTNAPVMQGDLVSLVTKLQLNYKLHNHVNSLRINEYNFFWHKPHVDIAIRCTHFIAPKANPHTEAQISAIHAA